MSYACYKSVGCTNANVDGKFRTNKFSANTLAALVHGVWYIFKMTTTCTVRLTEIENVYDHRTTATIARYGLISIFITLHVHLISRLPNFNVIALCGQESSLVVRILSFGSRA